MRLTEKGAQMARALAMAGEDVDPEALLEQLLQQERTGDEQPTTSEAQEPATKPLTMKNTFGTALGSAMLGFEQALRREPPAEILAAEHMPERGHSGDGSKIGIEFPEDVTETPRRMSDSADDDDADAD